MSHPRRNAPCPCGSGKKYKKCHGAFPSGRQAELPPHVWDSIDEHVKEMTALHAQRQKQQGLGRPIIAGMVDDHRIVAVGKTVHASKSWQTFHDFLRHFFLESLDRTWLNAQAALLPEQQHIVLRWHDKAMQHLMKAGKKIGEIHSAPMIGAARAFLNLAYNIYLIAHHTTDPAIVQSYVARLKSDREDTVTGALFETYAAAAFLRAGFHLQFEKEKGVAKSHVEFVATYPKTGAQFSIEVKARERTASAAVEADAEIDDVKRLRVGNKLNKALGKEAKHTRIVLIELNVPDVLDPAQTDERRLLGWPAASLEQIRFQETVPFSGGDEKPSAYVIVTNHAFHNNLDAPDMAYQVFATGFKIPDFCPDTPFKSYYARLQAHERHSEVFALLESLIVHYEIPSRFDGEIPDLAFSGEADVRLRLGRWYMIPTGDGRQVAGRLLQAHVNEVQKEVVGSYQLEAGEYVLARCPISDTELKAYRRYPETFFGQLQPVQKQARTLLDMCDFFFENYKNLTKKRLLEALKSAPDYERLKLLEQKELAAIYAERCALSVPAPKPRGT
jgi:hypothetical protein